MQDPGDQQNLNRYSYVDNNPLTHTDPSGYGFFSSLFKIGTQIGLGPIGYHIFKNQVRHSHILRELYKAAADVASFYCTPYGAGFCAAAANASIDSVAGVSNDGQLLKDAAIAGVTAEANVGIGFTHGVTNLVLHGALGGVSSVVEGGKFAPGFYAGVFTAAFAPTVHDYGGGTNLFIGAAESAVIGGTASVIGGGKFGNGALTGAFSYALNYCTSHACFGSKFTLDDARENYRNGAGAYITDVGADEIDLSGAEFIKRGSDVFQVNLSPLTDSFYIYGTVTGVFNANGTLSFRPDTYNFDYKNPMLGGTFGEVMRLVARDASTFGARVYNGQGIGYKIHFSGSQALSPDVERRLSGCKLQNRC